MAGVVSGIKGDLLTGGSLGAVLSSVRLTPPGVSEGRNAMERFPETEAADGTTSFCTGGNEGSSFFFLTWNGEPSKSVRSSGEDKGDDMVEGILLASARGLDIRSKESRMRRAVALVTPQG